MLAVQSAHEWSRGHHACENKLRLSFHFIQDRDVLFSTGVQLSIICITANQFQKVLLETGCHLQAHPHTWRQLSPADNRKEGWAAETQSLAPSKQFRTEEKHICYSLWKKGTRRRESLRHTWRVWLARFLRWQQTRRKEEYNKVKMQQSCQPSKELWGAWLWS